MELKSHLPLLSNPQWSRLTTKSCDSAFGICLFNFKKIMWKVNLYYIYWHDNVILLVSMFLVYLDKKRMQYFFFPKNMYCSPKFV